MNYNNDNLAHDVVYEMLYGKRSKEECGNLNFDSFIDTLRIAEESDSEFEFLIKYDLCGIENKKIKNIILEKKYGNGQEQEK